MTLVLADKWVWDFWFAQDGPDTHIFYLQADRSLGDESLRHWHVSVGHAVSQDLRHWDILPDALRPSARPEAFDSYTTWTGSIIRHAGQWHLFYTGGNRSEHGLVQRIGLATSTDLLNWERCPDSPLIETDPRWYELLDLPAWHDQAWRDPWVFQGDDGWFHAAITARVREGATDARGVIAHARSADLRRWEVLPPLTAPGEFGQMEVPQVVTIGGHSYLLFSVGAGQHSAARRARLGRAVTGTHYLAAQNPLGPYRYLTDEFLVGDTHGSLYSGKLVQDSAGAWWFMAFCNFAPDGTFIGAITDPMPVTVEADGRLRVERA